MTLVSARLRILPSLVGINGKDVEMQTTDAYIQWRVIGGAWQNLLSLAEVGSVGPATEYRSSGGYIQYRAVGTAPWYNLVPLSDIEGPQGPSVSDGNKGEITVSGGGSSWVVNNKRDLLRSLTRSYYVRTDGNDANTGLADNGAGAFLTLEKALTVAQSCDLIDSTVNIYVRAGTYTPDATITGTPAYNSRFGIANPINIIGDYTTPANVVLNGRITAIAGGRFSIGGFDMSSLTAGWACLTATGVGSKFTIVGPMRWGQMSSTGDHITASNGGSWDEAGTPGVDISYIYGGCQNHYHWTEGCVVKASGNVVIIGSPVWTGQFSGGASSEFNAIGLTFSGSATSVGRRELTHYGSNIRTSVDGSIFFFPGSLVPARQGGGMVDRGMRGRMHADGTPQNIAASGVEQKVTFASTVAGSSECLNWGGGWNETTDTLYPPNGPVRIYVQVAFTSGMQAGQLATLIIRKNGSPVAADIKEQSSVGSVPCTLKAQYSGNSDTASGDLFEIYVRADGATTPKTISGGAHLTFVEWECG